MRSLSYLIGILTGKNLGSRKKKETKEKKREEKKASVGDTVADDVPEFNVSDDVPEFHVSDDVPEFHVLIIGAGLSGICVAHHMAKLGLNFRILESRSGEGGTWFWNRYPGARLDVESWSYGFSFSQDVLDEWSWTEHFASQTEALRYAQFLTEKFDLKKHMQFDTKVKSAKYQQASRSWLLQDHDGKKYSSRFLITATGVLCEPLVPDYPGISDFQGAAFHSAHWPHNLELSGKRIGVIGTGATGIQIIQSIANSDLKSLTVFQRTASWTAPLRNSPITEMEMARIRQSYPSIFQKCSETHFSFIHTPDQRRTFDVPEKERWAFWEDLYAKPGFGKWLANFADINSDKKANAAFSDFITAKIRERLTDPYLASKLIPQDHGFGIKRLPLETGYYEAYQRPNVRLVDIKQDSPIERIDETGVCLSTGEHIDLDILVFATGFGEVTAPFEQIDFRGCGNIDLKNLWSNGPRTFLGMLVPHFPNMMMVMGPHQMYGNFLRGVEHAAGWISDLLQFCLQHDFTFIGTDEAEADRWIRHVQNSVKGLLMNEGDVERQGVNRVLAIDLRYNGPAPQYRKICNDVAERGYEGLIFR